MSRKINLEKKHVWIGLGVLGLVLLTILGAVVVKNFDDSQETVFSSKFILSTPTYLPIPTTTLPTPTSIPQPGNTWRVASEVDPETGLATFANVAVPSVTIIAKCQCPLCPAPEVGHVYEMDDSGLLVPIEGIESPLQRFRKEK